MGEPRWLLNPDQSARFRHHAGNPRKTVRPDGHGSPKYGLSQPCPVQPRLAFTLTPHLQITNYRGRFSLFVGI